ncbi:MAG: UDP-glucose/GDP-mannose dehydrogenase family protein [Deltaproteobacteria bacterium]|nr:UDP-glucose/GDP-mannose dehydrogenase family protein [Deltaproteobacteria bacterium]
MNICIIGSGYVGLVTGTCFADFGLNVTCVDKDEAKVKLLASGEIPIYEPGLKELTEKNIKAGRLHFTTDLEASIKRALVVFIAVGTPEKADGSANLTYVDEVALSIAKNLNDYKVIVTKSTVPVGTGRRIEKIIKENSEGEHLFDVASNPEFLREGSAVGDFMRPDRVVIGTSSPQAEAILKDLYSPLYLIETPIVISDIETAELIKVVSNAFLATKISFINEVAEVCERAGADVHLVAKAMGIDKRIGSKFLHPGPGFGGSCLPKDTAALSHMARDLGYDFKIVQATREVNAKRPAQMVEKIKKMLDGNLAGKTIGVLGLAFKPNTDDVRESPAIEVIEKLLTEGVVVKAFDPEAEENAKAILGNRITYSKDPYDAASGADAVVIATEWNQFRRLNKTRLKEVLKSPVMVDLRNVYEPEEMRKAGFSYTSIGRLLRTLAESRLY